MVFDFTTLITDRTQADLTKLKTLLAKPVAMWTEDELEQFNSAAMRGAYNYTDLNRVSAAVYALDDILRGYGYRTGVEKIVVPHASVDGSRLPAGYTELEYIQSSGTQYIDTGFKPNQDTRVVMDAMIISQSNASVCFFGTRNVASSTATLMFNFWSMNTGTTVRSDYFGESKSLTIATIGTRLLIDKDKNICKVNSNTITNASGTGQTTLPLYLFTANNAGAINSAYNVNGNLYSCKIYDNETLARDFIPCINPSGNVGLYDLVTAAFFGNAGTGTFSSGPVLGTDEHTRLLLHGEDLTDNSGYRVQVTNAGVDVSDSQSKFGGKSMYFNGNANLSALITVSGDLTVDFWMYQTSDTNTALPCPFNYKNGSKRGLYLMTDTSKSYMGVSTTSANYKEVSGSKIPLNTWTHIACIRHGTTTDFYINGTLANTVTDSLTTNDTIYLGFLQDAASSTYFQGYIDEFRVSDIARWTANFTPPTEPYHVELETGEPNDTIDPYTWYENDVPTASLMAVYLANVLAIHNTILTNPELPETMEKLTITGANQIEQALVTVETAIAQIVAGFARSNAFTFWSGNRPLPSAKSELGRNWAELDAMDTSWANWQVATWYLLLYGNLQAEGVVN